MPAPQTEGILHEPVQPLRSGRGQREHISIPNF
jgi:hypothetical protein